MKKILAAAVAVVLLATALFTTYYFRTKTLYLSDSNSGKGYLSIPINGDNRFSVTYTHSVHKTPVTEIYEIEGDEIYVVEARFHTFGAGMQTDYPDDVSMYYDDDGTIVLTGYHTLCKDLIYGQGRVADFVLTYDDNDYVLADICGRGACVQISIK